MAVFKPFIGLILLSCITAGLTSQGKPICKKLHVGTGLSSTETYNDIVKEGVTTSRWKPDATFAYIVGPYKTLEHFYLADVNFKLTQNDIELIYDQGDYVTSNVILKQDKKGFYTIEVNYHCQMYGGALINYMMNINVPGCGTASIAWKKLCGNPYAEREGLTIEMEFDSFRQVIVRNGRIINANIFDKDVDNFALTVPTYTENITFRFWLDSKDITEHKNSSFHLFGDIPMDFEQKNETECFVGKMYVDANEFFVKPSLSGDLAENGGYILFDQKKEVQMHLECQGYKGVATVEFDIPLYHFKDINLYFLKRCEGADPKASSFLGTLFFWVFIMFVAFVIYTTYQNVKNKGYFSPDFIPFYDTVSSALKQIKATIFVTSQGGFTIVNEHKPHKGFVNEEQELAERAGNNDERGNFFPDEDDADLRINIEEGAQEGKSHASYGTI